MRGRAFDPQNVTHKCSLQKEAKDAFLNFAHKQEVIYEP